MNHFDSLLAAVCIVWLISEIVTSVFRRSDATHAQSRDASSLTAINLAIYGALALAAWIRSLPEFRFDAELASLRWIGLAAVLAGIGLKWWSVFTLRKFFTVDVAVFDDHRLITAGPYRYVRHPSYAGVLLSFLGLGLAFGNWLAIPALLLPIAAAFAWRIRIEEASMRASFPSQYEQYQQSTRRLVPFLI